MAKKHKHIEFEVEAKKGDDRYYDTFGEAAADALATSATTGKAVYLNVLVYDSVGARQWAGEDGVERFDSTAATYVFDRFKVNAVSQGPFG